MRDDAILVTVAAGFIGFHLTKTLLSQGVKVVGVDNLNSYYDVELKKARLNQLLAFKNFHFHEINISDRRAMEAMWDEHPDVSRVIHLAAQAGVRHSLVDPYAYIESNIMGQLVLLELCRNRSGLKHFIYASSSSVYGESKTLPFSVEARCDHPISLYAATKRADELMTQSYAHLYRIPSTGLRLFTVYGPWGRPDMAVFNFTKSIFEGKQIQVFNNGEMRRDFTYIDDIVEGILGALERPPIDSDSNPPHQIYNLGCNRSERLLDFIEIIEREVGKKASIAFLPMQPGDVLESFAEISASKNDLGFEPKTPISIGLPKFITWFKEYYKL